MEEQKNNFNCSYCNYLTTNKHNWKKHLETQKHLKNTRHVSNNTNFTKKNRKNEKSKITISSLTCDNCGKKYRHRSGLSRHKKVCSENNKYFDDNMMITTVNEKKNEVLENQQKQISDLQSLLEKTIEQQQDTINKLIPKVGNTTNYNKMTVNLFLNEKCKDAMNLTDFVESLSLTFDDVLYTKEKGYVQGIKNIFLKNLIEMEPTNRPIHCSDQKRLSFYVKEEDQWEKDKEHSKLDRSIEKITRKQIQQIKEWEAKHPNWCESDEETQMYMDIVKKSMGGVSAEEKSKNLETIKKELGSSFDLKKIIDD